MLIPSLTATVIAAAVGLGPASLSFSQDSATGPNGVAAAVVLPPAPVALPVPVTATSVLATHAVVRRHPAAAAPFLQRASTHTVRPAPAAPKPAATRAAAPAPAPVAEPAAKPVTQPVTQPTAQPVAQPVAKPVSKPVVAAAQPTTQAGGDDYPSRSATSNASDPWGFTERQCVSFVAWRLSEHGRALNNGRDGWGSAMNWDDTARRLGRTISTRPTVGSIAQWNAGESSPFYAGGSATVNGSVAAGGWGHVGWVTAVYADGSVLLEPYNLGGDQSNSVIRVKAPRHLSL